MIGMKRTTTGVLLMNAEATATMSRLMSSASRWLPRAMAMTCWPMKPTAPVRIMPRLMRNMAATVMTAGLANPATASFGRKMPVTAKLTMMPTATRSTGALSVINSTRVTSRIAVTSQISMGGLSPEDELHGVATKRMGE